MRNTTDYIVAYLGGELSERERADFEKECEDSPELRKEVDDYRFIWEQTELLKEYTQFRTTQNWLHLNRRLHRASLWKRSWKWGQKVAAILLLPLIISLFYLLEQRKEEKRIYAERVHLTSAYGVVSKVVLPDSTVVWLNSGSTLTYPRRFDGGKREVELVGEAYFKVKADEQYRFDVVIPGQIAVSAYGTEFNVSAYTDEPLIDVVLAEGYVELKTGEGAIKKLKIGEQALYNKKDRQVVVKACDLLEKTAWIDGKLVFYRAGIQDILNRLSRHFNAEFLVVGKELIDYEFSATFTNESLEEILSILEKTTTMSFEIYEPEKNPDSTYRHRKVILKLGV